MKEVLDFNFIRDNSRGAGGNGSECGVDDVGTRDACPQRWWQDPRPRPRPQTKVIRRSRDWLLTSPFIVNVVCRNGKKSKSGIGERGSSREKVGIGEEVDGIGGMRTAPLVRSTQAEC